MQTEPIKVGDKVWTTKLMYFVDGLNPKTGEDIEMMLNKRDELTVVAINEGRYSCENEYGILAFLDVDDIEGV